MAFIFNPRVVIGLFYKPYNGGESFIDCVSLIPCDKRNCGGCKVTEGLLVEVVHVKDGDVVLRKPHVFQC